MLHRQLAGRSRQFSSLAPGRHTHTGHPLNERLRPGCDETTSRRNEQQLSGCSNRNRNCDCNCNCNNEIRNVKLCNASQVVASAGYSAAAPGRKEEISTLALMRFCGARSAMRRSVCMANFKPISTPSESYDALARSLRAMVLLLLPPPPPSLAAGLAGQFVH
jgi:hypothetical protein